MPAPTIFNPPAVSYDIAIDEEQRLMLSVALSRMLQAVELQTAKPVHDDWATLLLMLVELPEIEKKEPGIVHGLCL